MVWFPASTCLKPSYPLRRQLLLSFGSSALVTITFVVVLAIVSAYSFGKTIVKRADTVLRDQVIRDLQWSTRYFADHISSYKANVEGTLQIMIEITQDRIARYGEEGWEDDRYVPFFDMDSQRNVYPLKSAPLPFDWEIKSNVNDDDAFEHYQERSPWTANSGLQLSTATASFHMQGTCDPNAGTDEATYAPNCSAAHNQIENGGVVAPNNITKFLYEKSADIGVLLKPLFESQVELFGTSIFFHNGGAGASLYFPGVVLANPPSYISTGCDWMRAINPYTNETYGTELEISQCHKAGENVSIREYNPMERPFCRDIALDPSRIHWIGPFGGTRVPLVTVGKAVLDRINKRFIGCATANVALPGLVENMKRNLLHNESSAFVVRISDGSVLIDTIGSPVQNSIHVTETGVVNSETYNQLKKTLKVFDTPWTGESVHRAFADVVVPYTAGVVTASVIPAPPEKFEENYSPEFLLIHAIDNQIFSVIEELEKSIHDDETHITMVAIGTGVAGMLIVVAILICVSRVLTQPLNWMDAMAWRIVNHADSRATIKLNALRDTEEDIATVYCTPRTEISDLVSEVAKMIQGFSGHGASIAVEAIPREIKNQLTWQSDFRQLYSQEYVDWQPVEEVEAPLAAGKPCTQIGKASKDADADAKDNVDYDIASKGAGRYPLDANEQFSIVPPPPKRYRGTLCVKVDPDCCSKQLSSSVTVLKSSLFWWISSLIVIPLLLTNTAICAVATFRMQQIIPLWVNTVEQATVEIEIEALQSITRAKAALVSSLLFRPLRDLHLLTRTASWVIFDGIKRSNGFTEVDESTEECKSYAIGSCPVHDTQRASCPCDWNDINAMTEETCNISNDTEPRYLQRRFFLVQAHDADPSTGMRKAALSFPEVDFSAESTLWFDDLSVVPGASKGANASGLETTYDRVRVSSAVAVVEFPLYNHATSLGQPEIDLGTFLSFEADGMMTGFAGCGFEQAFMAHFRSNTENRAASIAPELCPLGKFGYDPRCRPWYADARRNFFGSGDSALITAPYRFANDLDVALTAASPLVNLATGLFLGVVSLDFYPTGVRQALQSLEVPISFIITPEYDAFGGNTVVGLNKTEIWSSTTISDLLFAHDATGSPNRDAFEKGILLQIQNGYSRVTRVRRTNQSGNEEIFILSIEPVHQRVIQAVDPSNFTRGVSASEVLVYSIGIAKLEGEMREPFEMIEDDVTSDLETLARVYIVLVVIASAFFMIFACLVTVNVTTPMLQLLSIVSNINTEHVRDDMPPLHGGSRESRQVYASFAKLYKIVRISNTAFFSGNVEWALHFLNDALQLFRKVNDQKAVGMACNNLGSTYAALSQQEPHTGQKILDMKTCALERALTFLREAIAISQRAFDTASNEELKAEFAQELADRFFNRGILLLVSSQKAELPSILVDQGYDDIRRARDLDHDTQDFWLARKLLLRNSETTFCRHIRRINGLISFDDDVCLRDIWDVRDLIEEADKLLFAAWNERQAPLFQVVNRIGRRQQLEASVIQLEMVRQNFEEAARISMRMFAEDDYILEDSFRIAASALLRFISDKANHSYSTEAMLSTKMDVRLMLRACKNSSAIDHGKSVVFAFEFNERWQETTLLQKLNRNCLRFYNTCCRDSDRIGIVAEPPSQSGRFSLRLGRKEEERDSHHYMLDLATQSIGMTRNPALPMALQMLVDSSCSQTAEYESYVLLFTDGFSWGQGAYDAVRVQVERMNRERNNLVHLVILGFNLPSADCAVECGKLCEVSKQSVFFEVDADNIDAVFQSISSSFCWNPSDTVDLQRILTMEKLR